MNNLGVMYEHGQGGLVKNEAEAVSWYQKAAHLGNVTAKRNLTRLQNAEAARQAVEVGDTEAVRGGGELTVSRLP
jgi:TPR repeat protein